ncbi:MAG: methyltransferase domain-containing protein [Mycolicibacterium neoaurum]|uniref:class I SAM-dependent methyltransferase n=1 Tax=Mycolicibacterium neoaurum TaxID=1795 RepID=UPI002FF84EFD
MTKTPHSTLVFDEWDERYTAFLDRLPARRPNPAIVAETASLPAGTALDIGCGLGADAVYLAGRGWQVTALDVSRVALEQAAAAAATAGVRVSWVRNRLEDMEVPAGGFDLVTAHYPALLRTPDGAAGTALLSAVAPRGTLLVVHHADIDVELAKSHGFDPAMYLLHDDVRALFDDRWEVRVERGRRREVPAGADGQHTHDDIIVARLLSPEDQTSDRG